MVLTGFSSGFASGAAERVSQTPVYTQKKIELTIVLAATFTLLGYRGWRCVHLQIGGWTSIIVFIKFFSFTLLL